MRMIRGLGFLARNTTWLRTADRRRKRYVGGCLRLRLRRGMTAALLRRSLAAMPLVAPRAAMTLAAFAARLAAATRTIAAMLALAVLARTLAVFGRGVNFVVALGARNLLADQLLD